MEMISSTPIRLEYSTKRLNLLQTEIFKQSSKLFTSIFLCHQKNTDTSEMCTRRKQIIMCQRQKKKKIQIFFSFHLIMARDGHVIYNDFYRIALIT